MIGLNFFLRKGVSVQFEIVNIPELKFSGGNFILFLFLGFLLNLLFGIGLRNNSLLKLFDLFINKFKLVVPISLIKYWPQI